MSVWHKLPPGFFVLAPMDDVTDVAFRETVAACAAPDLFFTEFVSADGLQSPGREVLRSTKLKIGEYDRPIIAQLWGLKPENFERTASELAELGVAGIDLNMGCPVANVIKHGACGALINNHELTAEIIAATKRGAGDLPVSVKTRVGFNQVDLSWIEFLLKHDLAALTVHGRTVKQQSKVPNNWELIGECVNLRNQLEPDTKLIGNGDILSRAQGEELVKQYGLDGVMIGRGIFRDPFIFAESSPWATLDKADRAALFVEHIERYEVAFTNKKNPAALKKFGKVYLSDFPGASELREELMKCSTTAEMKTLLASCQ